MTNAYQELYLTCFPEDTPEDAAHLFEAVFSKAVCIDRKVDGRPIAMLYLMDCSLTTPSGSVPYYYLYAACTHPDYRGRGIMGQLLEEAKQAATLAGKQGIFLKPANQPLFGFYEKSEFQPFFKVCKLQTSAADFCSKLDLMYPDDSVDFAPCTMAEWFEKRKQLLPHLTGLYADFPKSLLLGATDGCHVLLGADGMGLAYEIREDLLFIKEALAPLGNEDALLLATRDLLRETGCSRLELRMPATACSHQLLRFGAKIEPFSVIWSKDIGLLLPLYDPPYHGFAFD